MYIQKFMLSMVHLMLEEIKKSLYSSGLNVKQWQKWWWPDWFVCCRSNPGNNPAGPSWPGRHNISFHRGLLHMDREIRSLIVFILFETLFFTTFLFKFRFLLKTSVLFLRMFVLFWYCQWVEGLRQSINFSPP